MAKKKDLGICALIGEGTGPGARYFSPRKVSSGTHKNGLQLRKYDPVQRKHVLAKAVNKSKRVSSK